MSARLGGMLSQMHVLDGHVAHGRAHRRYLLSTCWTAATARSTSASVVCQLHTPSARAARPVSPERQPARGQDLPDTSRRGPGHARGQGDTVKSFPSCLLHPRWRGVLGLTCPQRPSSDYIVMTTTGGG